MTQPGLPVDAVLPELLTALATGGTAVLVAPTGSGKTTRVPPALAKVYSGWVVVLEPRRVAARAAARWVAKQWGCRIGEQVGYQVRDDRRIGPKTQVVFVTEGILLRWLQHDPFLEHVAVVVLDEFHERSVNSDLALSLLKTVREAGAPLRILVMSATLDAAPLSAYLDAPIVRSEGRLFPVEVEHISRPDSRPLEQRVADAVHALPLDGDVLVFLPGRAEIRRAGEQIHRPTFELHGGLDAAQQDAVFTPSPTQRVILSTNLAESSVTVPGIRFVIDSGLARIPCLDPTTGLDRLACVPIARDSAEQRAGRAGRLGPGRAIRLWTAADHRDRADHTTPALHRTDLAPTLLALLNFGEPDPRAFDWFDTPAPHAIDAGMELLRLLGAYDGTLTSIGKRLAGLPLHPRLARFLLEAHDRGGTAMAARWAAWLADGGRPRGELTLLQPPTSTAAKRLIRQLGPPGRGSDALARGAIAGWPDRVARQRGQGAVMANGLGVVGSSEPWFVAIGVHAARKGPRGEALVELECRIDPDWLEESEGLETRMEGERVCTFAQQLRGALVLHEHPAPLDRAQATEVLHQAASKRGVAPNDPAWDTLVFRLCFVARNQPHPGLPTNRQQAGEAVLHGLCSKHSTFNSLKKANWPRALLDALSWKAKQALERGAPEKIKVSGWNRKLTWTAEGPVLAARIQHLLGVPTTPCIAGEPVLLHLLAPNGRPQQITRDLAGFWRTTYFEVRKELRQRYPRHAWPDDPLA